MKTITVRLSAAPACLLSDQIDLSVTSSFPLKSERPPSIRPHCPLSRCLSLYMPYAAGSTRNPLRRLDASSLRYVLPSAAPHSMKGLVQAVPAANVLRSLTQGLNSDFGMYSLNTSLSPKSTVPRSTTRCIFASYALALFIFVYLFKFNSLSLSFSGLPAISFTASIVLWLSELPPPYALLLHP